MRKVIVTGANGFVGAALIKELIKNETEVIALGREENTDNIPESELVSFYPFDLKNAYEIKDKLMCNDIDAFYHFAWAGVSGELRADTRLQLDNAQWTVDCLKISKDLGCKRFIYAGSIMEIETYKAVFNNGNKPGSGFIYGAGKLAAHAMCKAVAAQIGVDFISAVITNAYGAGDNSSRMLNSAIKKCINGESPKFTAANQNYDFVYIDDAARAFRLIGEKGKPFCEYVIGSSNAGPLKQFLLEMKSEIAPDLDFMFGDIPFTGGNIPLKYFDCSKTEADTGFRAEISFREGIKRTRDWMLEENR